MRVVVGLFQAQEGLVVVDAVGHHHGFGLSGHLEQLASIEDTLLAVVLTLLIEDERHGRDRVSHGLDFLVQFEMRAAEKERVQTVVMDEQAIGDADDGVELGRQAAQRLDEAGMAFHLHVEVADDAVERPAVLVELVVFFGDPLQGIAHVEGEPLLL